MPWMKPDCQQYFQLPLFSVLLASALIGTNDERSPRNSSSRDFNRTGTRLDEYRRFRHVVRNVYTHRFDPAKLGKLVNSAPELFARTKAELLAFAAFLEHSRVILKAHLPTLPIRPFGVFLFGLRNYRMPLLSSLRYRIAGKGSIELIDTILSF